MIDIRAADNQEKVCRAYLVRFYESANVLNVKKKLLFDEVMLESFVIYPLMQSAYYYTGHPRINVTVCFVNNKITTCKIVMKLFHSKALILRNCNSTYSEVLNKSTGLYIYFSTFFPLGVSLLRAIDHTYVVHWLTFFDTYYIYSIPCFESIYFIFVFILIIKEKINSCNSIPRNKWQIQDPWENRCLYFDQFELFLHTQYLYSGAQSRCFGIDDQSFNQGLF